MPYRLSTSAFYKIVFVLSLFLLFFVSTISYKQLDMLSESDRMLELSDKANFKLEKLIAMVQDAEAGQRGYIISRDSSYLHPYLYSLVHMDEAYRELDQLFEGNQQQQENLAWLKGLIDQRFITLNRTLKLTAGESRPSDELISELNRGKALMQDIRSQVDKIAATEQRVQQERTSRHKNNLFFTPISALLISIFSLIVFVGSYLKINRDRKKMLQLNSQATQAKIVAESERLYRGLIEKLPAALYTCDENGYIQLYNKAAAELWGKEPELGKERWSAASGHFRPDGSEMTLDECPMYTVLTAGVIRNTEMILERPDGTCRNVVPYPQPIYDGDGKMIGALNMLLDITEEKISQKALEESELRLRIAVEAAQMATWDLDLQTREIVYSSRLNDIFGHEPGHVLTHPQMRQQIHVRDLPIVEAAFEEALRTGRYVYEARVVQPSGQVRCIRTEGKVIYTGEGEPVRMLGTLQDITEQKAAQEKIIQSEKLFRSISLNIPNSLVLVFDSEYKVLTLEGDLMTKLGYDSKDYEGKYLYDLGPIERHNAFLPFYERLFAGETFSIERKSDETGDIFVLHMVPMKNEEGEITSGLIIALDITEFKQNEDKIGMLGAIVESSDDAIVSKTLEGIITSWNKGAERIFGYTETEMIGKPISTLFPEDRLDEEPRILKNIREGRRVDHFETKRITKDGRVLDVSLTLSPVKNAEGKIVGASKIARDVTIQKQAERLLIESEHRFRTLIDAAPVMVWMTGPDMQREFFNKAWLNFTGRSMEDELFNDWSNDIHPEDLERYRETRQRAFGVREEYALEYRMKRFDEEYRWISDNGTPRFAADGTFLGYIGGCMDIHDRKNFTIELERQVKERTEELNKSNFELRHQKDFAEMILDSAIDIMIVYDRERRFLSFNKAAERIYKINKDDILGERLDDMFPSTIGKQGYNDLMRALSGEAVHNAKYLSPVSGLYYEDYILPLKDETGEVYAALLIARDITESIQNEALLLRLNDSLTVKNSELERSNAELASFNHVASHDLQEPLRKIQTFISRIMDREKGTLTERGAEYFGKIQSSANRMQQLIDDLLTFSRTNRADQQREPVDLNIILENVQRELAQTIEETGAVIQTEPLPVLDGIAFQFQQLFINLIGNALKYRKPDVAPQISVSCDKVKASDYNFPNLAPDKMLYKISVSDNGIGFEPQYASQIFELFQRLHGKMEYTGTGIGLTICKKIVENHDGFISAEGEPDKGSVFTIYLPV